MAIGAHCPQVDPIPIVVVSIDVIDLEYALAITTRLVEPTKFTSVLRCFKHRDTFALVRHRLKWNR